MPAGFRIAERDPLAHRVDEVHLSLDQIVPARRRRILEIGHVDIGAAIERVDHHLAVGRAGDFYAAVPDVERDRRNPPIALAYSLGLRQEIRFPTAIEPALDLGTAGEEATPLRSEFTLEVRDESDRLRGQHPVVAWLLGSANDSALEQLGGFGHSRHLPDCARRICPRR